ncbi:uncharacterized protein LOC135811920 [Sycon ciliatum]|uniref:uncharacterized protein LOC135811920 n=1 Tax=Sycon ciliatum TaxID=27933 RepID=UPI0031F61FD7
MIQTVTPTNMVNSTFSFQQNDSQIVFTESDTSGVTFIILCTTSYTTHFDCYGMGSNPPRPQGVIDTCVNASKSISTTVSVTIRALCPDLNNRGFNYKPFPGFSRQPGPPIPIECIKGFLSNNSMEITQSTCQGNGRWQPSPPLCESCMFECNDTYVVDCNHVPAVGMAMATVNCICGQNFQWTMGKCQPTHCRELFLATLVTIPRSAVGTSITASCKTGYDNISIPSSVNCQVNGTWTTLPTCQVTFMDPTAITAISATSTLSYTTTGADSQTSSLYILGTVIGAGIGGILVTLVAVIVYRKMQSKAVQTEVPSQTQNAAYEDADIAESSLTKSDAYGVVESSPQPQPEYICLH